MKKYPQEKASGAQARIKHRTADRELPCHLRFIQAGGDTVFERGYVLHSDLSCTGTRLQTDTKLSGQSSFTLAHWRMSVPVARECDGFVGPLNVPPPVFPLY
jgi:hypothetical protein